MADNLYVKIAKLNNENYEVWQYRVQLLLMKENLWNVVNNAAPAEPDTSWHVNDGKAKATIGLLVEDCQLTHIKEASSAKEAWDNLKRYHQKSSLTNKVFLLKRICSQKLTETGDMEKHINYMQEMIDKLAALGERLKDEMIVAIMLCSLPESYNNLITALESRSEDELTPVFVKGKLIDEFLRRRNTYETEETRDKALKIQRYKKKPNKEQGSVSCFFCKKIGHMKKDCRKYQYWKTKQEKANYVEKDLNIDEEEICFLGRHIQGSDAWFIDSGATSHMTNDKSFFISLEPREENIRTANGELTKVCGFGTGKLVCAVNENKKRNVTLTEVMYVPELDSSLLSVSKLVQKGFEVKFIQNRCEIIKDNLCIAVADLTCNLYKLRTAQVALMTNEQHRKDCQHTWHRKLGHRDINAIKDLTNKELATGMKITDCGLNSVCEVCIKGKMSRIPFPKLSHSKTKSILELVHTDVCGPMQTATPSNNRYMLTIIDDYSRYTEVHLLRKKLEVCTKLKQFVTRMETKFNTRPKIIRSDRGGEYTSEELKEFLKTKGIRAQYTAAFSPQQNGVAERKNRYLLEMARCMLIDAGLPNKYWGEAIITANYLQNRLPTSTTGETPYGRWHSRKPTLENIHIFGSEAYIQVPDKYRRKLDVKAEKLLFVGYSEDTKAYRFLNKDTDKIKVSRDAIFLDERETNEEDYRIDGCSRDTEEIMRKEQLNTTEKTMNYPRGNKKDDKTNQGVLELRRSERKNKGIHPKRYEFAGKISEISIPEPETLEEALYGSDHEEWKAAMDEEIRSLQENHTWTLVDPPENSKVIGCKWVYKIKRYASGKIQKCKARLVAQGFYQRSGIDYGEVFAPVARQTTFRAMLAIAGKRKMAVKHFDIKNAYLNGNLEEVIYMQQPPGFEVNKTKVCRLKKALYGLKQAAKIWNQTLDDVLQRAGFIQSKTDSCLYTNFSEGKHTYLLVYVDDILIASENQSFALHVENILTQTFNVTNLGEVNYYLGVQVRKDSEGFFYISQTSYIRKVLSTFNLIDGKISYIPLDVGYEKIKSEGPHIGNNVNYQRLIGALMYISVFTRPDITASVAILSRKLQEPKQVDWIEAKRVLRYLKGTINYELKLGNNKAENDLLGYADADWANNVTDRKSNSGYVFMFNNGTISWACRKQSCVALSSTEAEYIALADACQEAMWLRNLFEDFGYVQSKATTIYEDNQSCLKMITNHKFSKRTKHIDTKFHYIKHLKELSILNYCYCDTEHMIADMLTKPLQAVRLRFLSKEIGLMNLSLKDSSEIVVEEGC